MKYFVILAFILNYTATVNAQSSDVNQERIPEPHLMNLQQITYGGDNAEAYFSPSGHQIIFQSNNKKLDSSANGCDQIYTLFLNDQNSRPILTSSGQGRNTCGYFIQENLIVYASTYPELADCKPAKTIEGKYVWELFPQYEIYIKNPEGLEEIRLTENNSYDAEATVSPDGQRIVYTSLESGDLELWIMNTDGTGKTQITHELGYDGGAFFSPDGQKLVFQASRPKSTKDKAEYKKLLKANIVVPTDMEIYTCNVDGSEMKQITHLGKANWAPFYHPSGKKIIFSSNHQSSKGYDFQLFMINTDGSDLEQITFNSHFNSFPMFSPDGGRLIFSSNRFSPEGSHDTNLFIADWIE